jgi:hypothetical protein
MTVPVAKPAQRSARDRRAIDNALFDRANETLSRPGFPLGREMQSFGVNRDLRYDPRHLPPQEEPSAKSSRIGAGSL